MNLIDDLLAGKTFAESLGITSDMGRAVAALATSELNAGRVETAHDLLEGLALTNPHDAGTWCLLALVERRRDRSFAAAFCADVAARLSPDDPQVRLVRAEVRLALPAFREEALDALRALVTADGHVGQRARALLAALGAGARGGSAPPSA
jgi:thioredoxin-like negative regulator of GroEL